MYSFRDTIHQYRDKTLQRFMPACNALRSKLNLTSLRNILSEIPLEFQSVWIQIGSDLVYTVCKRYQQKTTVDITLGEQAKKPQLLKNNM